MSRRNIIDLILIAVLVLILAMTCQRREVEEEDAEFFPEIEEVYDTPEPEEEPVVAPDAVKVYYKGKKLAYASVFNDINDVHLEVAKAIGLKEAPENRDAVDVKRMGLVQITDTRSMKIAKLTHSIPYLTKGASKELNTIADEFAAKLEAEGLPPYRIIVNSVLRTKEDVARLRRSGNVNASENSAHNYATTFDISYVKYDKVGDSKEIMDPYELTKVLGEVLRDEREAGRCYVKYEKKQHCFHITSRVR